MTGDEAVKANWALLVGEIGGALSMHYADVELEEDGARNYTGRILIERPSGTWVITVAPLEEAES